MLVITVNQHLSSIMNKEARDILSSRHSVDWKYINSKIIEMAAGFIVSPSGINSEDLKSIRRYILTEDNTLKDYLLVNQMDISGTFDVESTLRVLSEYSTLLLLDIHRVVRDIFTVSGIMPLSAHVTTNGVFVGTIDDIYSHVEHRRL